MIFGQKEGLGKPSPKGNNKKETRLQRNCLTRTEIIEGAAGIGPADVQPAVDATEVNARNIAAGIP